MRTGGLIDLQVNGYAGVDFNDEAVTAAALDHALRAMLASGVTACLPTVITAAEDRMAARLAAKGEAEVTVIARGPHLAAMQAKGLRLRSEGGESVTHPRCVASAEEAGPQDYVVVTLQAYSLPGAAPQMQPLLGPATAIV